MKPKWKQNLNPPLNGHSHSEISAEIRPLSPTVEQIKGHMQTTAKLIEQLQPPVIPLDGNPTSSAGSNLENELPDYKALGDVLRIRPDEEIQAPPVCLSVEQDGQASTFGTLGNFSVIIGKAKSRKTFTISIAVAAALRSDKILNCFVGSFDENKRTVLYFDTEQGRYHVLKVIKRICRLAEQPSPANLFAYSLRSLPTDHRLGFIQWHIYNTPNVGLVIIDGIRDTVADINDNAEATERSGDLLRWTEECGIHIITVLHMNKGNDYARGTIGTELQNKAETVASIVVDPNNKDISVVTAEMCRDKGFEPFAFSIDEQGLPYIVEDWQADQRPVSRKSSSISSSPPPKKAGVVSRFNPDQHQAIIRRLFADVEPGKYAATWQRLKRAVEYFHEPIADNPAKELLTYYQDSGFVQKSENGRYVMGVAVEPESTMTANSDTDTNTFLHNKPSQ